MTNEQRRHDGEASEGADRPEHDAPVVDPPTDSTADEKIADEIDETDGEVIAETDVIAPTDRRSLTEHQRNLARRMAAQAAPALAAFRQLERSIDVRQVQARAAALSRYVAAQVPDVVTGDLLARMTASAIPDDLRDRLLRASGLADQLRSVVTPSVGRAFASELRLADRITPQVLSQVELKITADLARVALGDSGLSAWRTSLQTADRVGALLARPRTVGDLAALHRLDATSRYAVRLAEQVIDLDPTSRLIGPITGPALRAWSSSLRAQPSKRRILVSAVAGANVAAVMSGEALAEPDLASAGLLEETQAAVVTPWRDGPANASRQLHETLAGIEPTVSELLYGAWDDVERNGPAAVSKIANCCVEALDRTLRAVAPDADALTWHAENNRPASELHEGRPTRTLRVRYAMRDRRGEIKLSLAQVDAVVAFVSAVQSPLQDVKHTSDADVVRARTLLVSVEAVLHLLTMT